MEVTHILEKIKELIEVGKRIPLSNEVFVNEEELLRLVDALADELPEEVKRAQEILDNKESILIGAKAETKAAMAEKCFTEEKTSDSNTGIHRLPMHECPFLKKLPCSGW